MIKDNRQVTHLPLVALAAYGVVEQPGMATPKRSFSGGLHLHGDSSISRRRYVGQGFHDIAILTQAASSANYAFKFAA
jgi:hypothetical protein